MLNRGINLNDATSYQLGILYCIGNYTEKNYTITFGSRDQYYIEQINNLFKSEPYMKNNRYILKTLATEKVLERLNYNEEKECFYDLPDVKDIKEFIRAYLELHATARIIFSDNKKYKSLRVRIYGVEPTIGKIINIMTENIGLTQKTFTCNKSKNPNWKYVSYQDAEEVKKIFDYFTKDLHELNEYWEDFRIKLAEVM